MLKLDSLPIEPNKNKYYPSVYIKNVHLLPLGSDKTEIQVNMTLDDTGLQWSVDKELIDGVNISVTFRLATQTKWINIQIPLSSIVESQSQLSYTATCSAIADNKEIINLFISAECIDEYLSGELTIESILTRNEVVKSPDGLTTKIFDHRLLTATKKPAAINKPTGTPSNCYVSYTLDKRAHIGLTLDIDKYLLNVSENYQFLQNNEAFYQFIKQGSSIDTRETKIYVRNSSLKSGDFIDIGGIVNATRLSGSNFMVHGTLAAENIGASELNGMYDVRFEVAINDLSSYFFDKHIMPTLNNAQELIRLYRNDYRQTIENKLLKTREGRNEFYFSNFYDKSVTYTGGGSTSTISLNVALRNHAYALAQISSFFYEPPKGIGIPSYIGLLATLFASQLDPLIADPGDADWVIEHIEGLKNLVSDYSIGASTSEFDDIIRSNRKVKILKQYAEKLDFDYDRYYGYDVLFADNEGTNNGIKAITEAEQAEIRTEQLKKFFSNISDRSLAGLNDVSISKVYMGKNETGLQTLDMTSLRGNSSTDAFEPTYIQLNAYNKNIDAMPLNESAATQLSMDGVEVASATNRRNGSVNDLVANTLFDQNADTAQLSAVYLDSLGLKKIYMLLDSDNQYVMGLNGLEQIAETNPDLSLYTTNNLTEVEKAQNKAKLVLLYNSFFSLRLVTEGLYEIAEKNCASIYTKKLRQLNGYYIIPAQRLAYGTYEIANKNYFVNRKNSKYFNRTNVTAPKQLMRSNYE